MSKKFVDAIAKYNRVAIAGGPRTGKTTLAALGASPNRRVYHTDDFMHLNWKDQPEFIIQLLKDQSRYIVEGVQVARALRSGLQVDAVVFIRTPKVVLNTRQEGMRKTIDKIFTDWYDANNGRVPIIFIE